MSYRSPIPHSQEALWRLALWDGEGGKRHREHRPVGLVLTCSEQCQLLRISKKEGGVPIIYSFTRGTLLRKRRWQTRSFLFTQETSPPASSLATSALAYVNGSKYVNPTLIPIL